MVAIFVFKPGSDNSIILNNINSIIKKVKLLNCEKPNIFLIFYNYFNIIKIIS